jgi:hypothetical protein
MFVAVLLISPVGIAALFAFALFADRNFRDTLALKRGVAPRAERRSTVHRRRRAEKARAYEIS